MEATWEAWREVLKERAKQARKKAKEKNGGDFHKIVRETHEEVLSQIKKNREAARRRSSMHVAS